MGALRRLYHDCCPLLGLQGAPSCRERSLMRRCGGGAEARKLSVAEVIERSTAQPAARRAADESSSTAARLQTSQRGSVIGDIISAPAAFGERF